MGQALKSCPICGGEARYFDKTKKFYGWDVVFTFTIMCRTCGLQLPDGTYHVEVRMGMDGEFVVKNDERQKAADDWNRRIDDEIQK